LAYQVLSGSAHSYTFTGLRSRLDESDRLFFFSGNARRASPPLPADTKKGAATRKNRMKAHNVIIIPHSTAVCKGFYVYFLKFCFLHKKFLYSFANLPIDFLDFL